MSRTALLVVLVGFLVMFSSSSIKSAFQVNFASIGEGFGISRGGLSISGSLFMLVTGVGSLIAGILCDRIGVKKTILVGAALAGLALVTGGLLDSFPVFVATYGVVAALGFAGMQWVPMGLLIDQVFSDKAKGIAYATVTNGTAIGFVVLSPLWVWLNLHYDWSTVFLWLGLFFLLPLIALVGFGLRVPEPEAAVPHSRGVTKWREVLTGAHFWFLALSFAGCGINMAFIDMHLVPMMQDRQTDPGIVASTLSALGFFEIIGGFAVAALTASFSLRLLLTCLYFVRGLSVFTLAVAESQLAYILFGGVFGLTYLGTVIVTSLYCLRFYGREVKGAVFGALWFGHQLGAVACVSLGALAYDIHGDYHPVVVATGGVSMVSALLALTIPARQHTAAPVAIGRAQ